MPSFSFLEKLDVFRLTLWDFFEKGVDFSVSLWYNLIVIKGDDRHRKENIL